jgi:ADP-heptose:LPS heptosyltransferase
LAAKAARLAGGSGNERADLRWIVRSTEALPSWNPAADGYVALAPSSAWPGKEWPVEKYFALIEALAKTSPGALPVILGTETDRAATALCEGLRQREISFVDLVGRLKLPQVASALARCRVAIGPDTGLLHLAEAVGTRVFAIYGPTRVDFGFGVSRRDSSVIHGPVGCSPCSKDGTLCHRFGDRYACLRKLDAADVAHGVRKLLQSNVAIQPGVSP